jgi:hypothetical protein
MKKMSKKSAKKMVEQHNRQVARANKAFEALSPAEKRISIARDVIAQLATKRLVATSGLWLAGKDESNLFNENQVEKNLELQEVLAKTKECTGCALGGMFMCAVKQADKLKLDELECVKEFKIEQKRKPECAELGRDGLIEMVDAFRYLRRFFSKSQLEMIETAFEQNAGACHAEGTGAGDFAVNVKEPSDRMRLIMENVIVNKGRFVPSKEPIQAWVTPGFVG